MTCTENYENWFNFVIVTPEILAKGKGGDEGGRDGTRVTVEPGPLRALLCHCTEDADKAIKADISITRELGVANMQLFSMNVNVSE